MGRQVGTRRALLFAKGRSQGSARKNNGDFRAMALT